MNNLVTIKNEKLTTTSRKVAEAFDMQHLVVLRAIRNLECSEEFSLCNFALVDFTTAKNQTYQEYVITEAGAMRLVMGFTGSKAAAVKEQFIQAFQAMQDKLAKQNDKLEWKAARLQGKSTRAVLTNTLSDFVTYAKAQGSENADKYYASVTLMEYKALSLIEKGSKVGTSFRDTLDTLQIGNLITAEHAACHAIKRGMEQGLHYKEIYQLAKLEVEKLAAIVNVYRIN